jgi:hypothetical protein
MTVVYVLVGICFALVVGYLAVHIIADFRQAPHRKYYCDSCQQYLGTGRKRAKVCPRCGDYRYYIRLDSEE